MIRTERRGRVLVVTIDRPERRNALDLGRCQDLLAALREAGDARAVVLAGAGGNFSAGADLSAVPSGPFLAALRAVLDAVVDLPVPVVAGIEGVVFGAGLQLAVACDLRVATADSRFAVPAAKLGLVMDHRSVGRLALLAGPGPARALLLAAEEIDGATAVRLGLVQRAGGVDGAVAWAEEIAALAPLTVAAHKLALNRLERTALDPDVEAARRRAWASADLAEGVAAFAERRPPRFEGR
ncbi:MAG TPA: enoyl-CoA hydratase-related protein [Acidimicrobiales bacterium]|nr:enoyl-CoA hydratase-related protein [Acidimicrobiales bacterium]